MKEKHDTSETRNEELEDIAKEEENNFDETGGEVTSIEEILKELNMEENIAAFNKEKLETKDLLNMNEEDLKDVCKDCGILTL